jgi:hypothetical protein
MERVEHHIGAKLGKARRQIAAGIDLDRLIPGFPERLGAFTP